MLMQALSNEQVKFGTPVRYRPLSGGSWLTGETVEVNGPELTFFCDAPLELDTKVEVVLPAKVQAIAHETSINLLCTAQVIRRFLANWPDVRPALAISISSCQIAPRSRSQCGPSAARCQGKPEA